MKHDEQYEADNGDRIDDAEDGRVRRRIRPVNATLGTAGDRPRRRRLRPRDRHPRVGPAQAAPAAPRDRLELQPPRAARRRGRGDRHGAGAHHPRLHRELRARQRLEPHAADLQRGDDVVGPRGVDPAVGADPRRASPCTSPASSGAGSATRSSAWRCSRCSSCASSSSCSMLGPANPFTRVDVPLGLRRPRPEPAAAGAHPHGVPPADALPRLRRVHGAVRVRHRRAGHRPPRRGMAGRDPAGHAPRLGVPHRRHHPRRLVELRGARLGRLLGLGPGRERVAPAVAHRHRLPPLGDGAGAPRDAPRLEPVAAVRHVQPHDPRHVPHPLRRARVGARLQRQRHRRVAARVLRAHRRRHARPHRLARRPAALAGRIDSPLSREGAFLANNVLFAGLRVRRAARHGVPAARRGAQRPRRHRRARRTSTA